MKAGAGFWIRFGATIVDAIIVGIPLSFIAYLIVGGGEAQDNFSRTLMFLYTLLVPIFWSGYTVGKRLCGIRIRKVSDHMPPGLGTMLLRNVVGGLVYAFTLGIAAVVSAFMVGLREDRRAIHDLIAGTEVVYD